LGEWGFKTKRGRKRIIRLGGFVGKDDIGRAEKNSKGPPYRKKSREEGTGEKWGAAKSLVLGLGTKKG